MLSRNVPVSSNNDVLDGSTYIQIPIEGLDSTFAAGEGSFEVVANVFLEQLSDGSFRLVRQPSGDTSTFSEGTPDIPMQQNVYTGVGNQENNLTVDSCLENSDPLSLFSSSSIANIVPETPYKSSSEVPTSRFRSSSPSKDLSTKYGCSSCTKLFDNVRQYRDHFCIKKFMCSKCKAGYNEENNLKIHTVLTHSDDNITRCPICGINLTFQRMARLRSHMLMHQVEEIYSCKECGGEYDTENEFLRHFERHKVGQLPKDDRLKCLHCKVKFDEIKDYRRHVAEHVKANRIFSKARKIKKTSAKSDSSHVCSVCGKTFPKKSLLLRHERIHNGEKPYKCTICERCFSQKGTLQTHWKRHAGIKPHACTLCPAKFTQKGNLRVHIQKTHTVDDDNQKLYKCSQCSCVFRKIAALNGHVTKLHSNPSNDIDLVMTQLLELQKASANMLKRTDMAITQSDKSIEVSGGEETSVLTEEIAKVSDKPSVTLTTELMSDGATREHIIMYRKINDIQWYYCNYCPTRVKKPSDLIRHIRVHTKEKPYKCKLCKAAFTLKLTLRHHMRTHKSNKVYRCSRCEYTAPTLRLLNSHTRKHKNEGTLSWSCITCDCQFENFEKAQKHKAEFSDRFHIIRPAVVIPPKNTEENNVPGTVTVNLTDFFKSESADKHFQCEICGVKFSRKISLMRHLKNHRGDRKFKCTVCSKSFIALYRLKEHMNFHNQQRKFGCKFCEKRYVTSSLLKRHMVSHTNLRPYVCTYCSKTFKSLPLCRLHIKRMHKSKATTKMPVGGEDVATLERILQNGNPGPVPPPALQSPGILIDQIPQNISTNMGLGVQDPEPNITTSINQGIPMDQEQYETVFVDISNLKFEDCSLDLNVLQKQIAQQVQQTENLHQENSGNKSEILPADLIQILNSDGVINDGIIQINRLPDENSITPLNELPYVTNNPGISHVINTNDLLSSLSINSATLDNDMFEGSSIICRQCNNVFLSLSVFQNHPCNHMDNGPKTGKEDSTRKTPDPDEIVQCDKCLKFLKDKDELRAHMRQHQLKKNFECGICNKVMRGRKTYQRHKMTHAKYPNAHGCKFCGKEFKKASDLSRHVRIHTGEKPFACTVCDKKFTLKSTLESHQRTHEPNQKRFLCEVCSSCFSSKPSLKLHMSIHTGQKPFSCTFCSQKFRTMSNKRSHENLMHLSNKERSHPRSQNATNMRKVLESVTMDIVNNMDRKEESIAETLMPNNVPTQMLNVSLPSTEAISSESPEDQTLAVDASSLLQQLQMNGNLVASPLVLDDVTLFTLDSAKDDNIQIISLSELGSGWQNDDIIIQRLNHKVPDQVKCDICLKTYSSKSVLSKHKRNIHGITKRIVCGKCNKMFCTLEELESHDKLHQGYRPFSCMLCNNSFAEEQNYKTHMKRIHQQSVISKETTNALLGINFDSEEQVVISRCDI